MGFGTKIKTCICMNEQQDLIHGKGMRVHNAMKDDKGFRCTSCGASKAREYSSKVVKKK